MKAWDEKLEKFVEPVDDTKPKFVNAYFPWNEELAKATKVDVPHYEPVKEKQAKAAAFEYSIEIACAQDELNTYQVGVFSLGKTKEEGNISTWNKTQNEKGFTLFTASVDVDEPKVLSREFFISSGSAMVFDEVKPVKKGVAHATESFVPIKPSIQVYERLSWPKVGFFYHFIDDELINEYQLTGGDKWSFKITQSKGKALSNELLSEHEYSFILLPWKINNVVVARQHLLYTKEKITQEQLSDVNAAWLDENARCLNPNDVVNARSEKALEREKNENGRITYSVQSGDTLGLIARKQGVEYESILTLNPQITNPDLIQVGDVIIIKEEKQTQDAVASHICKINPETGQRETWEEIAAQYGMTAKALYDLNANNPAHKDGALALGDELLVNQQQTVETDESYRNAQSPADLTEDKLTFPFCNVWSVIEKNHTELAYVPVQEEKAIKNNTAIVNVKSVLLQSKLLAQSEILESIAQGKKEIIKKGAKGDEVKLIQEALQKMKFDLGRADGDFGSGTESAIKTFQNTYTPTNEVHPDYKIGSADGVVGSNTLLALDEAVVGQWKMLKQPHPIVDSNILAFLYKNVSVGLTNEDYEVAAKDLGCEIAAIKAVALTETGSSGSFYDFHEDLVPSILFERHYFSRLTNGAYDDKYPDISNKVGGGYGKFSVQYEKLAKAYSLDSSAALKSASWGRFQIMGANHKLCNYETVEEFVYDLSLSENNHLRCFVEFIKSNNQLHKAIKEKDWLTFALKYNGPKQQGYDVKMRENYEKISD